MSLELPPASSLRRQDLPERRRGLRRRRRRALLSLALAASASLLAASSYLALRTLNRPRLESLEPSLGEPGGEVLLRGRNFGAQRGEGRVDIDELVPTSGSYLAWTDTEIRLRLPASLDSGLLRVVTRSGVSKPKLFMNRARLPVLASAAAEGGGPRIASISPEEGPIGSLVTIRGEGFGEGRGSSELRFAWAAGTQEAQRPGDLSAPLAVSPSESESGYEKWTDGELRARVPDGAVSGSVYLVSDSGKSNGSFFRVSSPAGSKRYSSPARYSLSQTVSVTRVRASGPSELYLWAPLPAATASQRLLGIIDREPEPVVADYRGTSLFRFSGLASGRDRRLRQTFLVEAFAVEAAIDPAQAPIRPQDPPAFMAALSAPDSLVPSGSPAIQELARRILRGERGSWRAARMVWDYLAQNLAWSDRAVLARPIDALSGRRADSYSYAIAAAALLRAAGLPTLPVAGYLVDASRRAVRHYWVEVYLYGLGWVPLDPVLGSGASPGGLAPAWIDRSRYFGGVDNRHIAFSRGFSALTPLSAEGRRVSKDRRWSFQSFYEESSGALEDYSSFWGDIEVTGMY